MKLVRGWFVASCMIVACGCTPNTPEPPPTPPPVVPVTPTSNTPVNPQKSPSGASIDELIALLPNDDARNAKPADQLAARGKAAVPALTAALAHQNWRVRAGAVYALGQIGKDAADVQERLEALAQQDENSTVRDAAAFALDAIQEASAPAKN
jgi:hypothetical protein